MNNKKLIRKFNKQADTYDRMRENHFQREWRKKLLKEADGVILEAAVGAGGNFPYFHRNQITEITAVDFSPAMLKKAEAAAQKHQLPVTFLESDLDLLEFKENQFDTIVSTLSFCGYPKPLRMLEKFSRWCKPDGQILLLEHGISSNVFFALLQRALDPIAVRTIGCHQNRNIMNMISRSSLEIVRAEHFWLGVFHLIWTKPKK